MATSRTVKDISPHEFVKAYASHLKRSGKGFYSIRMLIAITLWLLLCCLTNSKQLQRVEYLHQEWGPTFCLDRSCIHPLPEFDGNFTIHGLFPMKFTGGWEPWIECHTFTKLQTFSKKLNEELRRRMPNLLTTWTNEGLWEYQMRKHGTCSAWFDGHKSPNKHSDFFWAVLDLQLYGGIRTFAQMFGDKGMQPSPMPQPQKDFSNAIQQILKAYPTIKCGGRHNKYLAEIVTCFNTTNSFSPFIIDCNPRFVNCPQDVIWPESP